MKDACKASDCTGPVYSVVSYGNNRDYRSGLYFTTQIWELAKTLEKVEMKIIMVQALLGVKMIQTHLLYKQVQSWFIINKNTAHHQSWICRVGNGVRMQVLGPSWLLPYQLLAVWRGGCGAPVCESCSGPSLGTAGLLSLSTLLPSSVGLWEVFSPTL